MAKFADTDLFNFENEFESYFDNRFNQLINAVVSDLSTSIVSPVYTGYFASSWTARKNNVQRESRATSDRNRREKEPWATVYNTPTQGKDGAMTPWGVKKIWVRLKEGIQVRFILTLRRHQQFILATPLTIGLTLLRMAMLLLMFRICVKKLKKFLEKSQFLDVFGLPLNL